MRGGERFVTIYDVTNRRSLEAACHLNELVLCVRCADRVSVVLVGNNIDPGE